MAQQDGSPKDKVRFGFRLCLARPPRDEELRQLVDFQAEARESYAKQPEAAKMMAGTLTGNETESNEPAELAAWAAVGNVLLNLDEMLMRP